jgi:hypothetical protein
MAPYPYSGDLNPNMARFIEVTGCSGFFISKSDTSVYMWIPEAESEEYFKVQSNLS